MNSRVQYLAAFLLILMAAFSRLIPHPLNFTPIAAIGLFGAVYFDKKFAFVVPFAAMVISDYFIGFYNQIYWVYGSFILIVFMGLWLKNNKSIMAIAGTTLASSILFFVVTNFGVWFSGTMYSKDVAGIIECYIAAIPFFKNTLTGDASYVAILFGVYELVLKYFPESKTVQA